MGRLQSIYRLVANSSSFYSIDISRNIHIFPAYNVSKPKEQTLMKKVKPRHLTDGSTAFRRDCDYLF